MKRRDDPFDVKRAADAKPGEREIAVFVPGHYPGAIENGRRIVKVWSEPGDSNPVGTLGTVLASHGNPKVGIAYFIEWDTMPGIPVFVAAKKVDVAQKKKAERK